MDVWTGQFHAAHLVGRGFKAATMDADDETGLRDIADWWHTNDMDRYLFRLLSNAQLDLINHEANGVLSRSDLHQALEAYQFVFVPKEGKNSAHVLGSSARDLAQEVHNVPARIHRNTEEAYLLVRFAKAIIRLVELNQAGFRKQQHLLVTSIHTVSDKAASSAARDRQLLREYRQKSWSLKTQVPTNELGKSGGGLRPAMIPMLLSLCRSLPIGLSKVSCFAL